MAAMTASTFKVNSEPSTGTGLLRPLESKSPRFIRWQVMELTFPLLPSIFRGATRYSILIPSSSAALISSSAAGISCLRRRYNIVTLAPRRNATRAASIAEFPPPITATFLPKESFPLNHLSSLALKSRKNSTPPNTFFKSSPGTPIFWLYCAPVARYM